MLLAIIVSIPVSGEEKKGIDEEWEEELSAAFHEIASVADILVGLTAPPLNQAMLQIELVLEADRLGKLNKDVLRRPPA